MNHFKIKVKQFFPAYLIISPALIIVYTFLHWLLIIHLNFFEIKYVHTELTIPMLLPWIPLVIWMRPRLLRLNIISSGRRDPVFALIIASGAIIIGSLCISQQYLRTATGKLSRLDSISEMRHLPPTKYYTVNRYYVAKRFAHFYTYFSVTNKGNDFNIDIYGDIPFFDRVFPDTTIITRLRNSLDHRGLIIINGKPGTMAYLKTLPADSIRAMRYLNPTLVMPHYGERGQYGALAVMTRGYKLKDTMPRMKITPVAWLAIKFTKTLNNNTSSEHRHQQYLAFVAQCDTLFKHTQYKTFTYLDRVPLDEQYHYLNAIRHSEGVDDPFPTFLYPVYDSYANKNGDKLAWFWGVNVVGAVFLLLVLSLCKSNPDPELMEAYTGTGI
jgi:hypothetical protein